MDFSLYLDVILSPLRRIEFTDEPTRCQKSEDCHLKKQKRRHIDVGCGRNWKADTRPLVAQNVVLSVFFRLSKTRGNLLLCLLVLLESTLLYKGTLLSTRTLPL